MLKNFRQGIALRKILFNNLGKITMCRGPLGHFWFDTEDDVSFDDLVLPKDFTYPQHLYSANGGGQFLIINDQKEQVGRINTYAGKK